MRLSHGIARPIFASGKPKHLSHRRVTALDVDLRPRLDQRPHGARVSADRRNEERRGFVLPVKNDTRTSSVEESRGG